MLPFKFQVFDYNTCKEWLTGFRPTRISVKVGIKRNTCGYDVNLLFMSVCFTYWATLLVPGTARSSEQQNEPMSRHGTEPSKPVRKERGWEKLPFVPECLCQNRQHLIEPGSKSSFRNIFEGSKNFICILFLALLTVHMNTDRNLRDCHCIQVQIVCCPGISL